MRLDFLVHCGGMFLHVLVIACLRLSAALRVDGLLQVNWNERLHLGRAGVKNGPTSALRSGSESGQKLSFGLWQFCFA
jgi:hypothetical protein